MKNVIKFSNFNLADNIGVQVTCRRGIKWAMLDEGTKIPTAGLDGKLQGFVTVQNIIVKRFRDIENYDIANEHDPLCRNVDGLLDEMRKVYPGFDPLEIVTLIQFKYEPK